MPDKVRPVEDSMSAQCERRAPQDSCSPGKVDFLYSHDQATGIKVEFAAVKDDRSGTGDDLVGVLEGPTVDIGRARTRGLDEGARIIEDVAAIVVFKRGAIHSRVESSAGEIIDC